MSDTDPFKTIDEPNYLEVLVGEGKKFQSPEALAKGKFEADTYIETLKNELAAEKAKSSNGMNVETLLTEIRKINEGKNDPDNGQPAVTEPLQTNTPNIEDIVLQTLRKTESERSVQTNRKTVIDKMSAVWGADTTKELKKTADSLGVSVEYLDSVASQSPSVFFQLTGLNANRSVPSGTTVPTSRVNLGSTGTGDRDQKFYKELKRSNPALFKDMKTQVQMQSDALRQGEAFFNA